MTRFNFCLHMQGISLCLQTNSKSYISYLHNYLDHLELSSSEEPQIEVFLNLRESIREISNTKAWELPTGLKRMGRRLLVGEHEIVCQGTNLLSNLQMHCKYGEKIKIYGYLNLNRSSYLIKRFYQQQIRKKKFENYKHDIYATLTYYFIYYPILYQLEQRRISLLHASAIMTDSGKGILMPGLPGVGKSTLSLAFLAAQGSKFLSDNIVLYDTTRVYSFFEPLKLDAFGMSLIDIDEDILISVGKDSYYDRQSFRISTSVSCESLKPDILLIPVRSSYTELMPITANRAVQLSLDFNNIAGEVNSYLIYASIQNLCNHNIDISINRIEWLKSLYDSMDCYFLYLKARQPLKDVLKIIESKL